MTPDHLNSMFEFGAAAALLLNVFQLRKDKRVAGVRILPTAFFALWGFWNLYYYPVLGQWWSFTGGLAVVIVNSLWVAMAIYYRKKSKGERVKVMLNGEWVEATHEFEESIKDLEDWRE